MEDLEAIAALRRKREQKDKRCAIFVGVLVTLMLIGWQYGERRQKQVSQPPETAVRVDAPCADVKTLADWDKADAQWQKTHPECKPR